MSKNQQVGTKSKQTLVEFLLKKLVEVRKRIMTSLPSLPKRIQMIIHKIDTVFFGYVKKTEEYTSDGQKSKKITEEYQPRIESIQNWLQLVGVILIPLVILYGTSLVQQQQTYLANQQHIADQQIADKQRLADQQIADKQQQETILQTYLDSMSDLLLTKGLSGSKPEDPVRMVAREQTLTTLRRLYEGRDRFVLQFLQDARLIGIQDAIIDLSNADLSNDDLSGANLSGIGLSSDNLSNANLRNANLDGTILNNATLSNVHLNDATLSDTLLNSANLSSADLSSADLGGADLSSANLSNAKLKCKNLKCTTLNGAIMNRANLSNAILSGAILSGADLSSAILSDADLSGAILSSADLSGAVLNDVHNLTQQQLDEVNSCTNATLSRGLTCHRN